MIQMGGLSTFSPRAALKMRSFFKGANVMVVAMEPFDVSLIAPGVRVYGQHVQPTNMQKREEAVYAERWKCVIYTGIVVAEFVHSSCVLVT